MQGNADARLRIMAARVVAQNRWPYVSGLLFSLRLVEVSHDVVSTMAVDSGWRLYYSPQFVLSEDVEALATVLLHECLHCVMNHNGRFSSINDDKKNHEIWNICGDCSINEILDEANMPWTKSVTPVRFSNFVKSGISKSQITETSYFQLFEWLSKDDNRDHGPRTDCGSVTDSLQRSYEIPENDSAAPSISKIQQDNTRDRVASDVLEALRNGGNVPGGLKRWASDRLDPQIDWRRQLGVYLRKAVANVAGRRDYSYLRPARRQEALRLVNSDIVLPSLRQPTPPRVAIVVDTSGSVSDSDLKIYLGEIYGIAKSVGVTEGIFVIPCDSKVYEIQKIRNLSKVEDLKFEGGGGTDLREGITAALALQPKPNIVVLITDGLTPWPENRPNSCENFLVVLTKNSHSREIPNWMKKVCIEEA